MIAPWADGPFAVLDTETTGPDPHTARIVTACVGVVGPGSAVQARTWLVDPGVAIPPEATAVHGVTTERAAKEGARRIVAIPEIRAAHADAWAQGPLVIMNAPYDLTVLDLEMRRHHLGGLFDVCPMGPVLDPLVIDRACDQYRKGPRNLSALVAHYNVRLDGAHSADGDALAAARVVWRQARQYPALGVMTLDEMQPWQAEAYAAWANGFADHLRRQGGADRAAQIDTAWPIRLTAGVAS